jgi:RNA polymerase sigma-70 factor (ECF subfamily)
MQTDPYCSAKNLIRMVQEGSPDALDRLTRCYGARLLSAGVRHCRTKEEAEDAVQDALLIAFEKGSTFRGEGSLEGWLIRIVARACRRMSRGQKNDVSAHDTEVELATREPSPVDLSCRGETGRALQEALLDLDPTDRMILLLSGVEEWTAPEIAGEIGLTPGAVRTRLSRLREKVAAALSVTLEESDPAP